MLQKFMRKRKAPKVWGVFRFLRPQFIPDRTLAFSTRFFILFIDIAKTKLILKGR